jgi:molybdopterin-guanine dinucleotide biosynthesis protein A
MGAEKYRLPVGEFTALECVVQAMLPVTDQVLIIGAAGQTIPRFPEQVTFLVDEEPDGGPLAGMAVGLRELQRRQASGPVLLSGCDIPLLRPELLRFLLSRLDDAAGAAIVSDGIRPQPMPGCYRLSVSEQVTQLLARGERSLQSLIASVCTRLIPMEEVRPFDPAFEAFRPMNTPEEYQSLLMRLRSENPPGSQPLSEPETSVSASDFGSASRDRNTRPTSVCDEIRRVTDNET